MPFELQVLGVSSMSLAPPDVARETTAFGGHADRAPGSWSLDNVRGAMCVARETHTGVAMRIELQALGASSSRFLEPLQCPWRHVRCT